jgi:hypothetical protein
VYLRSAIFDLAGVDTRTRTELERGSYATPFGTDPLDMVVRGKLRGDHSKLAAPGQPYPRLLWRAPSLGSIDFSASTGTGIVVNADYETLFGQGVTFEVERYMLGEAAVSLPPGETA